MAETVLITGASGGLGLEFARIFASRGYNLILAARSLDKLQAIAAELSGDGASPRGGSASADGALPGDGSASGDTVSLGVKSIHVDIIQTDLSQERGAEKLYAEVKALGRPVDQFVNNAGAGKAASTVDIDPDELRSLIHLDVTSYAMLCRLIGADMVRQGHGKILNVSSTTAFFPDPYFNIYGPSKAFVMSLTEAMRGELRGTGVSVTALCPGPVRTGWAERAGKAYPAMAADPAKVAMTGFRAMQAGRLYTIPGVGTSVGTHLLGLLPRTLRVMIGAWWQSAMIRKGN